jgi:hypothetical protein
MKAGPKLARAIEWETRNLKEARLRRNRTSMNCTIFAQSVCVERETER